MPQLTFPASPDGLPVDVFIGLNAQEVASLQAAEEEIPLSIQLRGLLETACDVTAVHSSILHQLGVTPKAQAKTSTAGGSIPVNLFEIRLSITDARNPGGPWLMYPSLLVMELPYHLPNADCLIGLDILFQCKLFVDGPGQSFTLEF